MKAYKAMERAIAKATIAALLAAGRALTIAAVNQLTFSDRAAVNPNLE